MQAPLLPKLRGHFAEFLDNASPAGLRILSSSTCVGFRYGLMENNSGFSRRTVCRLPYFSSVRLTASDWRTGLLARLLFRLHRSLRSRLRLSLRVPTVLFP